MTRTDQVNHVDVILLYDQICMRMDEIEARASAPVSFHKVSGLSPYFASSFLAYLAIGA